MTHVLLPTDTPNVVIGNATIRKYANIVLGALGIIVTLATLVDVSIPEIDIAVFTVPATQIILGAAAIFGLAVTTPNVPKRGK
jgi:hypothetical protein